MHWKIKKNPKNSFHHKEFEKHQLNIYCHISGKNLFCDPYCQQDSLSSLTLCFHLYQEAPSLKQFPN